MVTAVLAEHVGYPTPIELRAVAARCASSSGVTRAPLVSWRHDAGRPAFVSRAVRRE